MKVDPGPHELTLNPLQHIESAPQIQHERRALLAKTPEELEKAHVAWEEEEEEAIRRVPFEAKPEEENEDEEQNNPDQEDDDTVEADDAVVADGPDGDYPNEDRHEDEEGDEEGFQVQVEPSTSARDLDESAPPVDQGEAAEASPGLEADEVPP